MPACSCCRASWARSAVPTLLIIAPFVLSAQRPFEPRDAQYFPRVSLPVASAAAISCWGLCTNPSTANCKAQKCQPMIEAAHVPRSSHLHRASATYSGEFARRSRLAQPSFGALPNPTCCMELQCNIMIKDCRKHSTHLRQRRLIIDPSAIPIRSLCKHMYANSIYSIARRAWTFILCKRAVFVFTENRERRDDQRVRKSQ